MKRCPFCAEEIQDAAIKCRYCGSSLLPAAARASLEAEPAADPAPVAGAAPAAPRLAPAIPERRTIYEGCPSWKAYLGHYVLVAVAAIVVIFVLGLVHHAGAPLKTRALDIAIPLAAAFVIGFGMTIVRRSTKFRVMTTAIEFERGLLSKRIDVVQLWRIRDVVYRQNLLDRVLGIAHIEVIASDTTTPDLQIVGMPASRQLFEQLRDSIEIQRQAKNVVGVVT